LISMVRNIRLKNISPQLSTNYYKKSIQDTSLRKSGENVGIVGGAALVIS